MYCLVCQVIRSSVYLSVSQKKKVGRKVCCYWNSPKRIHGGSCHWPPKQLFCSSNYPQHCLITLNQVQWLVPVYQIKAAFYSHSVLLFSSEWAADSMHANHTSLEGPQGPQCILASLVLLVFVTHHCSLSELELHFQK